ncbi:MAG: sigma-70 family RNA polymerase sigma factor [Oscillospiraceae bacterium]|nr:sigma-70 family RNA polymerase sigma factor [Oscillospiraceae bacterium]
MEEPKRFFIPAEGQLIEVSEEVYRAYYGMDRRERYLEERDLKNGLISYHTLDTPTHGGEAAMSNIRAPSVEDEMLASELLTLLHRCINVLPRAERELIQAIYFEGMTENEYAKKIRLTQSGVSRKRKKILSKLKELLNILGSF